MKHFTTYSIAFIVTLVLSGSVAVTAQTLAGGYDESTEYFDTKKYNKWRNSPDFKKALTILNNDDGEEKIDYDEAIILLENEIKQHPSNGYAMCSAAMARISEENLELNKFVMDLLYGDNEISDEEAESLFKKRVEKSREVAHEVIDMFEKGIALLPAADKANRCKAYVACGDLQKEVLEDDEKTLAAYEQAAAIMPCYQSYDKLMRYYLDQGDNDKALFYASKLGSMIDDDNEVLELLAQVYINKNDYEKAMTYINKAINNDDSDPDAHQQLFNLLLLKGKYQEALDKTIEMSELISGSTLLQNLATVYVISDDCKAMVIDKLHQLEAETPEPSDDEEVTTEWNYFEGMLYYSDDDYRNALTCFDKVLERKPTPSMLSLKADCHYMLGDAPQAIRLLSYAMRMPGATEGNNIKDQLMSHKIRYEMLCGMTDEQIYDSQVYCKAFPNVSEIGYEALTRGYFNKGEYARALEACDQWAEQFGNTIDPRYMHAYVLMLWGKTDQAREEMQDIINDESCTDERKMFALFYMGEIEKSRAMLEKLALRSEPHAAAIDTESERDKDISLYNIACAYSLHGDIDRALYFLERYYAEEDRATDFDYAILDDELNNARKDPRFMEIVNRYKQQWLDGKLGSKK